MEINKLLKKLDLSNEGRYENKFYILPIADSNEYAKMYTLLDTNTTNTEFPSFELNTNNNLDKMVNYFETTLDNTTYNFFLIGDLANDNYYLKIGEKQ